MRKELDEVGRPLRLGPVARPAPHDVKRKDVSAVIVAGRQDRSADPVHARLVDQEPGIVRELDGELRCERAESLRRIGGMDMRDRGGGLVADSLEQFEQGARPVEIRRRAGQQLAREDVQRVDERCAVVET